MDLENTNTLAAYRAAGGEPDSGENQRIVDKLVDREVGPCVSYLVSALYKLVCSSGGGRDADIDEDELRNLMVRSATSQDAAEDNGFDVIMDTYGDWYWYDRKIGKPDLAVPPPGYTVLENGDDDWEGRDPAGDEVTTEHTKGEAILACWADVGVHGPFDSDDEAWENVCKEEQIDVNDYDSEVYEHWIVSGFAGRKLKAQGEVVDDLCNVTIWGRCCTGQSIAMDGTWQRIAAEMGILDGQAYSWAEKPEVKVEDPIDALISAYVGGRYRFREAKRKVLAEIARRGLKPKPAKKTKKPTTKKKRKTR